MGRIKTERVLKILKSGIGKDLDADIPMEVALHWNYGIEERYYPAVKKYLEYYRSCCIKMSEWSFPETAGTLAGMFGMGIATGDIYWSIAGGGIGFAAAKVARCLWYVSRIRQDHKKLVREMPEYLIPVDI